MSVCHEGYDTVCGKFCTYPECMRLRHLSDPGPYDKSNEEEDENVSGYVQRPS